MSAQAQAIRNRLAKVTSLGVAYEPRELLTLAGTEDLGELILALEPLLALGTFRRVFKRNDKEYVNFSDLPKDAEPQELRVLYTRMTG
jgi:hypothetical protein